MRPFKVVRGGSWLSDLEYVRPAFRSCSARHIQDSIIGLRLAFRSPDDRVIRGCAWYAGPSSARSARRLKLSYRNVLDVRLDYLGLRVAFRE